MCWWFTYNTQIHITTLGLLLINTLVAARSQMCLFKIKVPISTGMKFSCVALPHLILGNSLEEQTDLKLGTWQ